MGDMTDILAAFLLGCCAGIAPWHWLARRTHRLLEEIKVADAQALRGSEER